MDGETDRRTSKICNAAYQNGLKTLIWQVLRPLVVRRELNSSRASSAALGRWSSDAASEAPSRPGCDWPVTAGVVALSSWHPSSSSRLGRNPPQSPLHHPHRSTPLSSLHHWPSLVRVSCSGRSDQPQQPVSSTFPSLQGNSHVIHHQSVDNGSVALLSVFILAGQKIFL